MTPFKFAKFVRAMTSTDSSTLTDDRLLLWMNAVKDDIVKDIAKINEDIFGMYAYRNVIHNQREYSLPEELLDQMKYLEADLKGDGKYRRVHEIDLNTYERSTDEKVIRSWFAYREPAYDIFRNSIFIYSGEEIIDVKDGLRGWYIRYPNDFTDLTNNTTELSNDLVYPTSNGISKQFHLLWATKVIVLYKNSKEKPIALTQSEQDVEKDYQDALRALSGMNLDRDVRGTVPSYNNGLSY